MKPSGVSTQFVAQQQPEWVWTGENHFLGAPLMEQPSWSPAWPHASHRCSVLHPQPPELHRGSVRVVPGVPRGSPSLGGLPFLRYLLTGPQFCTDAAFRISNDTTNAVVFLLSVSLPVTSDNWLLSYTPIPSDPQAPLPPQGAA